MSNTENLPQSLINSSINDIYDDPAGLIELANNYQAEFINIIKTEIEEQYPDWLQNMIISAKTGGYRTTFTFKTKISFDKVSAQKMYQIISEWFAYYQSENSANGYYKLTYLMKSASLEWSYIIVRIEWLPTTLSPQSLNNKWETDWALTINEAYENKYTNATLDFDLKSTYEFHPNYPIDILVQYIKNWLFENKQITLTDYDFDYQENDSAITKALLVFNVKWEELEENNLIDNSLSGVLEKLREVYKQNLYTIFDSAYYNNTNNNNQQAWNDALSNIAEEQGLNAINLIYKDTTELQNTDYLEDYLNNIQLLLKIWWNEQDPDFIFTSTLEDIDYENRTIKFKINWNK